MDGEMCGEGQVECFAVLYWAVSNVYYTLKYFQTISEVYLAYNMCSHPRSR